MKKLKIITRRSVMIISVVILAYLFFKYARVEVEPSGYYVADFEDNNNDGLYYQFIENN